MPVTPDSPWRSAPRITLPAFATLLAERGNPGVVAERHPEAYYDKIVEFGVDPLFILAMFWHESQFGRFGVARVTHSWGNTRNPTFGAKPVGEAPGASGSFPIFRDWLDGCVSTVARLVATDWVYHDREPIREIFEHPSGKVWAPAGDFNNPSGYLRAVIDFMNANESAPPQPQPARVTKPPMRTDIRATAKGGYANKRRIDAIVWHKSDGNEASDLNQLTKVVSANAYITKRGVIFELVPPLESPWTNGQVGNPNLSNPLIHRWIEVERVNPNTRTLTVECEGETGEPLTAEQALALCHLSAWWCQEFAIPADRTHIIGHFEIDSVNRGYCPGFDADYFNDLIAGVQQFLSEGVAPPAPEKWVIPGNPFGPYGFIHGFRATVEKLAQAKFPADRNAAALSITGYPLEDEWGGVDGCAYQQCERVILQWNPQNNGPFDVVFLSRHAALPERAG